MNDKDKHKGLTVIEGGKQKGRTGKAESGLTIKQETFCQALANGKSNSESYREAYCCDDMAPSTIHEHASRLAASDKVRARVEALLAEKRAEQRISVAKNEDRIWTQVWSLLEGDTPPAVKVSAATLAARLSGMLTDKVEISKGPETAEAIEKELLQRLARYK